LYVLGVLTAYVLPFGSNAPFPYALCGLASILILPYVFPELLRVRLRNGWPIISYLFLATIITAIAAEPGYLMRSLRGISQLYYSVTAAVCLYFLVRSIPRFKMANICLSILVIMAILSVLEFLGPLRGLSDSFREMASPGWGYSNDDRDLSMHGAVRSKVFSPEPSTAAESFFWISMLFLWSSASDYRRLSIWFATVVVMLWTVRSPSLIAAIACSFITIYAFQFVNSGRKFTARRNLELLGILATVILVVSIAAYGMFVERLSSISSGEASFTMRITGALQFAAEYVTNHVWFGTGVVGDLEMLTDQIASFYISLGLQSTTGIDLNTNAGAVVASRGLANNIAIHFVYFGGIGGIVAGALIVRALFLSNAWLWAVLLLQIFSFSMSNAGYNSAPIWCIGSSLLAAAKLKEISLKGPGKSSVPDPLQTRRPSVALCPTVPENEE